MTVLLLRKILCNTFLTSYFVIRSLRFPISGLVLIPLLLNSVRHQGLPYNLCQLP